MEMAMSSGWLHGSLVSVVVLPVIGRRNIIGFYVRLHFLRCDEAMTVQYCSWVLDMPHDSPHERESKQKWASSNREMGSSPFLVSLHWQSQSAANEDDISLSQKKRFRMGRALANGWTTHKHLQVSKAIRLRLAHNDAKMITGIERQPCLGCRLECGDVSGKPSQEGSVKLPVEAAVTFSSLSAHHLNRCHPHFGSRQQTSFFFGISVKVHICYLTVPAWPRCNLAAHRPNLVSCRS